MSYHLVVFHLVIPHHLQQREQDTEGKYRSTWANLLKNSSHGKKQPPLQQVNLMSLQNMLSLQACNCNL